MDMKKIVDLLEILVFQADLQSLYIIQYSCEIIYKDCRSA